MTTAMLLTLAVTAGSDPSGDLAKKIKAANEQARQEVRVGSQPPKKKPVDPTVWKTAKVPPADAVVNPIVAGEDAPVPVPPKPKAMPAAEEYREFLAKVRAANGAKLRLKVTAGHYLVGQFIPRLGRAAAEGDEFDCFMFNGEESMEPVPAKPVADAAKKVLRGAAEAVLSPYPVIRYALPQFNPFPNCGPTG